MKNFVFVIIFSIFALESCKNDKDVKISAANNIKKDTVLKAEAKPFKNPAIIYGTDFLSFMQAFRKTGNLDLMIAFTSSADVKKQGKDKIKEYFENNFKNMSKLKLMSIVNKGNIKTLNYINLSFATRNALSVDVIIENDSCKLILPKNLGLLIFN